MRTLSASRAFCSQCLRAYGRPAVYQTVGLRRQSGVTGTLRVRSLPARGAGRTARAQPGMLRTASMARSLWIQSEPTPNENALKFLPGTEILPADVGTMEFVRASETAEAPLARRLFGIDGVEHVFYGNDFITVSKDPEYSWAQLKAEIFSVIMEHLSAGLPVLHEGAHVASDTQILDTDDEVVAMIKELLDTRIRPMIQEDGGDIEYRGFSDDTGTVRLKLRGACRTCDSSTVTLRNGIESMLKHYIPEVEHVEQVLDPEEEIAIEEFDKFERDLARRHAQS